MLLEPLNLNSLRLSVPKLIVWSIDFTQYWATTPKSTKKTVMILKWWETCTIKLLEDIPLPLICMSLGLKIWQIFIWRYSFNSIFWNWFSSIEFLSVERLHRSSILYDFYSCFDCRIPKSLRPPPWNSWRMCSIYTSFSECSWTEDCCWKFSSKSNFRIVDNTLTIYIKPGWSILLRFLCVFWRWLVKNTKRCNQLFYSGFISFQLMLIC